MSLSKRLEKLEAATAPAEERGPMILIFYEGETEAETLARYGLPEDYRASVWLPDNGRGHGRVTIGGIDLKNDI